MTRIDWRAAKVGDIYCCAAFGKNWFFLVIGIDNAHIISRVIDENGLGYSMRHAIGSFRTDMTLVSRT